MTLELADTMGNNIFKLCCAWGAEREARLIFPDGVEISDQARLLQKLKELLGHGRGTYEKVLMARQAELIATLDRIKKDREAISTLADIVHPLS